jgi:hypothetical protein
MILLQIAQAPATDAHQHLIIGMLAFCIIAFSVTLTFIMKVIKKKNVEIKLTQQQHTAKIDMLRKEHSDTLERIRLEMLKREEERTRQWMESEKETLHVLNGVSTLLDLSDKLDKSNSEKILKILGVIQDKVEKLTVKE